MRRRNRGYAQSLIAVSAAVGSLMRIYPPMREDMASSRVRYRISVQIVAQASPSGE